MSTYLNEILEQVDAIERLYKFSKESDVFSDIAAEYRKQPRPVVFVGMGSSNFAPTVIRTRLSQLGIPYRIEEAGELLHYEMDGINPESWVVSISQSGESYETKVVTERLKGKVEKIIVITNEESSSLAKLADNLLPLKAEYEAGSTTKTFVNTLLSLHLLVDALSGETLVTKESVLSLKQLFSEQSETLKEATREIITYLNINKNTSPDPIHVIGRGPMMATANQSALILGETTDLHVTSLPGGTFRHGPYELSGPNHRAIFLAPSGRTQDLLINMAREVHNLGSRVVLISDTNEDYPFFHLRLPQLDELLAPLLYFLPIELFGYNVSVFRGREPGIMRNMSKVTHVE